jgi:hypothetical protein
MSEITDYKNAFDYFKGRFLEKKNSIFTGNENILNNESIEFLMENYVKNPIEGKASFEDKIKYQFDLINEEGKLKKPEELNDKQKQAVEVFAHLIWLWKLVPANSKIESTQKDIKNILGWIGIVNINNNVFNKKIKGFAKVGTYFFTNKPLEMVFLIKFLNELLSEENKEKDLIDIILEVTKDGEVSYEKEENDKIPTLDKNGEFKDQGSKFSSKPQKVAMFNALLHLIDPENYEPIISFSDKEKIYKLCEKLENCNCNESDIKPAIDCKIKKIKESLKKEFNKDDIDFYDLKIKELWDETVLPAKNVIYYGAPGTGKTYNLVNLIEAKTQNNDDYYEIVQFHPNYTYEDFIDGVKPVGFENGNLKLQLVDGIFKKLCKKAFKELKKADEENRKPKNFYLLIDEINRANLSAVFGEILSCIEEDKRLRFEDGKLKGLRLKTSNSNLWKNEDAVVIEGDKRLFGVPENLYILATMNDIDRSIDSFDLALRRRFKWIRKTIDYDVITETLLEKGIDDNELENYIDSIKKLNKYISETLGLGKSYELGHSYFMNVNVRNGKISKSEKEGIFDQEIEPLLREYLRSEYDEEESEKKLKEAKKIFLGEDNGKNKNG